MFLSMISTDPCMIIHYIMEDNIFFRYCLHAFITKEILKPHIKDCFKINRKQTIKITKKSEYVKFKHVERKIKSTFMIYENLVTLESILVPEDLMESKF